MKNLRLNETLEDLQNSERSIVAFNINSMYQLCSLYKVANRIKTPTIAQFSKKLIPYYDRHIGIETLVNNFQSDYLFFHLDHCEDLDLIQHCVNSGFHSVMCDGSKFELDENIKLSNDAYKIANKGGSLLEVELGIVGGVEDEVEMGNSNYYDKDELIYFNENTNFDLLALSIGNVHGLQRNTDLVNPDLLIDANELIGKQFYTLHGGTGLSDEILFKAIRNGIVKINISTELKLKTIRILKEVASVQKYYDEINYFNEVVNHLSDFFLLKITKYTQV